MSDEPAEPNRSRAGPLLRTRDQACIAALTSLALALMIGAWILHGGLRGNLIEIDPSPPQTISFQVDLNSADWPELMLLPGIGKTLAQRIVQSRRRDGPFRSCDDLRRVRGIGPITVQRVRPYLHVKVGGPKGLGAT